MSRVLEHFILPVDIGIDIGVAAILELLQFTVCIGCAETVVLTGLVQRIGIVVGTDHISRLWVELELV